MNETKCKKFLIVSIGSFAMSSISFLLIPFSNFNGSAIQRFFAYMVGAMFWLGFIVGLIITYRLGSIRKKAGFCKYPIPGILCFFKNKSGIFFDIMMLSSLALFIAAKLLLEDYGWVWIIMLAILLFSVFMHSIFNGNNYFFIVQKGVKQ